MSVPPAQHFTTMADYRDAHPQTVPEKNLSIVPRVVVFSGQINGNPVADSVSNGVVSFYYDNDDGDWEDILPNMTIEFGSLPGYNDLGAGRIHSTHPAVAGQIFIGEVDPRKFTIQDNTYFSVIFQFAPHTKIPRIVGAKSDETYFSSEFTEYHDYDIEHVNQNANFAPKANICGENGGQFRHAGWVDSGETTRLIYFESNESESMAGGTTTAIWTFYKLTPSIEYGYIPDIVSGGLTSTHIEVNLPAGFYYVKLEAQCSFNGQRDYIWIPVWVHDPDYLPFENVEPTKDSRKEGRDMAFRFFGNDNDFDSSQIPKNTTCCYWEIPHFEGIDPPLHYIYCFLGWATRESTTIKIGNRSQFSLDVGGAATWLKNLDSYHYHLNQSGSVTKWYDMDYLTTDRSLLFGIREYSTMAQLINIHFSGLNTRSLDEDVPKGKQWDQIQNLAQSICAFGASCDSTGGLWFRRHYSYLESGLRYAEWSLDIQADDWTDNSGLIVDDDKTDPITMVNATGADFTASVETVVNTHASGSVGAGDSGKIETLPFQRLVTGGGQLAQLKSLSSHHFARLSITRTINSIKILGNYDWFEPAWNEPIKLLQDVANIRGVLIEKQYLVTGINVSHSREIGRPPKEITWGIEEITIGSGADEWVIASENGTDGGEPFFPIDLGSDFTEGMAPIIHGPSGHDRPKTPPSCDDVPLQIIATAAGMTVTQVSSNQWRCRQNTHHTVDDGHGGFLEEYTGTVADAFGRTFNITGFTQGESNYFVIGCDGVPGSGTGGGLANQIISKGWHTYNTPIDTIYTMGCEDCVI